jgi:iron complex transport system ATP-binding protein
VLHDLGTALQADDVVVMQAGLVVHHGASDSQQTHQAIEAVFDNRISIHNFEGQFVALPKL